MSHQIKAQFKTEVLALGTMHLNQIKDLDQEMLAPLLDELKKYNFDIVGIENMPTELLNDISSRSDSTYFESIEGYGSERLMIAAKFQKELGVTLIEAKKESNKQIAFNSPNNEARISLIRYFLAGGDFASAVLQFSYLDKKVKIEERLIDSNTITRLKELSTNSNEI